VRDSSALLTTHDEEAGMTTKQRTNITDAVQVSAKMTEAERAAARHALEEGERQARIAAARSPKYGPAAGGDGSPDPGAFEPSPGRAFVESEAYGGWLEAYPGGGPTQHVSVVSPQVVLRMALAGPQAAMRALITAADASAGSLVAPDRGPLEPGLVRPLTIRQLVAVIPTSSDAVEFPRETSRTSAAAPVAEATALTGTSGTKPEGGLTFELVEVPVRTIAVWAPATRRIVQDAPFLRQYIDDYLTHDLGQELEDQILSGDGLGQNFTGILNDPNIGDAGAPGAGESALDQVRKARRLVVVNGRTIPTAVLLHPGDAEAIDLLKVNAEANHFVNPPFGPSTQRVLWGMTVIETDALPEGTGLVGDFRKAVLFDREQVAINVGTVGDDFIRNIVRVLAEMRAGFVVARPQAFATFTIP